MSVQVVLLTQADCDLCDRAKSVLDACAQDFPLEVSTVDLNSPEGQEMGRRGGIMFPPGVFLDDEPFGYGRLSERKLRKELRRRVGPLT
ncbi:MAG: glutaredoxin family protein [Actinomycetota bacterium]|jgi:glutaredoxin|uniref:glutaredoxin family protein n=1 Tax=Euzebya pacifica TaxID=1608957 RepID=UPI0030F69C45